MSLSEKREPHFFYGYVIIVVSVCIMVISWGTFFSFGVFLEPLLTEFGLTRAVTSSIYSLALFVNGFLSIVIGRLNDRFGPRLAVTVCGLSLGLGYLLLSQISVLWQLYILYGVLIGVGMSGTFVPLASTVTRWFVKRRGLMTGIITSGQGLGLVIMVPIISWLVTNYGWRQSYIIVGVIILVLVISAAQFLKRDPAQLGLLAYGENKVNAGGSNLTAAGYSLREAMHTKQFWMLSIMFFSVFFCLGSITVHIVIHATGLGISVTAAANILAIIGGIGILGRIILGSVGDRISNKVASIISFSLMSVALFWLAWAQDLWMLYLVAGIFGLGFGGVLALLSPMSAELFGLRSQGVILGVFMFG
ncbi:MFS transporter, partial [Chloroflexota bacterium]